MKPLNYSNQNIISIRKPFPLLLSILFIIMLTSCGTNKGDPVDEPVISYSSDVAPILDQKCVGCHGEIQPLAGLNLSTYAGIMKGSQGNLVVIIGEPNKSLLITQIKSGKMPKYGEKLSDEQVDIISIWVEHGALDN